MHNNNKCERAPIFLTLLLFLAPWSGYAAAASEWFWAADGEAMAADYQGAERLHNQFGVGAQLAGEYLERGGFELGYHYQRRNLIAIADGDAESVDEHLLHLGGHGNFFPHHLHGRLTPRFDAYVGRDRTHYLQIAPGAVTSTDHILVLNPVVSFLDLSKTVYIDLGYAYSRYRADLGAIENLYVHQWAPTLGFGRAQDWVQLRAFYIRTSDSNRAAESDSTLALEIKWSRRLAPGAPLGASDITLTLLGGERRFTVDSDARAVNTLPDLQKGGVSLAALWKRDDRSELRVQGGIERYEDTAIDDVYHRVGGSVTLSQRW